MPRTIALLGLALGLVACGSRQTEEGTTPASTGADGAYEAPNSDAHADSDADSDSDSDSDADSDSDSDSDADSDPGSDRSARGGPEARLGDVVEAHNALRARHCAPPLRWSEELARVAQGWADSLVSRGCAFEHNPGTELGENLAFFGPPGSMDAERVVQGWYDEVRDYRFARPGFSMRTGHFTQVVWAATTEIGCGAAVCGDGEIWVCNYAPPGNVLGAFPENVRPVDCGR